MYCNNLLIICDNDDDDDDDVLTWLARTSVCFFGAISPNFNLKNMISTYTNDVS